MSKDIYVVAEQRDAVIQKVSFELISEAKRLSMVTGEKVYAILAGAKGVAEDLGDFYRAGADGVIYVEDELLKEYTTEPYTKVVSEILLAKDPNIVLFGATSIGRDLAPRVAARIHTGLTADCTKLEILDWSPNQETEPEKLLYMTRPAFGGNIMATILCKEKRPQMATVRPGVMKREDIIAECGATPEGTKEEFKSTLKKEDMNVVIREVVKCKVQKTDIIEAKALISGGRGIGSPEAFSMLKELAELLEADISSSRANVDAGWIDRDRQVGQTGKTVRPSLYMACGISGAIQHVAGMEDSDYVIAINKNETAAIFDVADLGIVGDLKIIIPKLIEGLKRYKELNRC
jgi:electron transfer flavoprotein alpha subunit